MWEGRGSGRRAVGDVEGSRSGGRQFPLPVPFSDSFSFMTIAADED